MLPCKYKVIFVCCCAHSTCSCSTTKPNPDTHIYVCVYPGPLPAVADLTVNNVAGNCSQLNVTWVAPFSLNLTTAEPDIQYCVDVYNITYERKDNLLQSECIISDTQYLFEVDYLMGTYYFLVTPRSNIDSSLNGTTSTAQFSYGKVNQCYCYCYIRTPLCNRTTSNTH